MSGQTKWLLGLVGLCFLGFILLVGSWRSPGGQEPRPVELPKPEQLGTVLPASAPAAVPTPPPPARRMGIAPAQKSTGKLMPTPEELKQIQKDGSVVY